jgi:choline dehydrogenase-like flavoprotein
MGPSGDRWRCSTRGCGAGVEGLRVCDLSAMPNINAGNTTAPALMLGSRCAEFVLGKGAAAREAA